MRATDAACTFRHFSDEDDEPEDDIGTNGVFEDGAAGAELGRCC